jgi:hypothetical protein
MQVSVSARTARASSPAEIVRLVRDVDATLIVEITTARRRLEQLSPEITALMAEVARLQDRVVSAAAEVEVDSTGSATDAAWSRVAEVTGGHELTAAVDALVSTYPRL